MTEDRGDTGGHGELEVLQVDPHGSRHQLSLLGGRHQVDRELESGLKLVTQSHLPVTSFFTDIYSFQVKPIKLFSSFGSNRSKKMFNVFVNILFPP